MNQDEKIIPALDVQSLEQLNFLIKELSGTAKIVKIGMELYYSYGNQIVERLKEQGFKIFLDLKLHDIPNTIYRSSKTLSKLGVDILNVHAAGGIDMMKAALDGFKECNQNGILIGVTQLTSTSQETLNNEILIPGRTIDVVLKYAENVKKAGLQGVVCSALEVEKIKESIGIDFKCITPGIRPKGTSEDDQVRVVTPKEAIHFGSDYLVIGRSIYQAKSPKMAFENIVKEIS